MKIKTGEGQMFKHAGIIMLLHTLLDKAMNKYQYIYNISSVIYIHKEYGNNST